MTCVQQVNIDIRIIPLKGQGAWIDVTRIVASPSNDQIWMVLA